MKFIFLLLVFFSFNSYGSCQNKIPYSEAVKAIAMEPNAGSKTCTDLPSEECMCYDGIIFEAAQIVDGPEVLDYIAKLQTESCVKVESEDLEFNQYQDCDTKFAALVCAEGTAIKNYDLLEVYCAKDVMKATKQFAHVEEKLTAFHAKQAASAAYNLAELQALKAMECGKYVIRMMLIRNASKSLTTAQSKETITLYRDIVSLLEVGSMKAAKEEIQAVQVNEPIATEADKNALVDGINRCMGYQAS